MGCCQSDSVQRRGSVKRKADSSLIIKQRNKRTAGKRFVFILRHYAIML